MNKFLKKIVDYLIMVGILKKDKDDTTLLPIDENDNVEESIDESLFEETRDYHLIPKYTKISDYHIGDIIIARRYESLAEKKTIPVGHREGPYVVVDVLEDSLIVLYATGASLKDPSFKYRTLLLDYNTYPDVLYKDTYVHVAQEKKIFEKQILHYIGSLNDKDLKELNKKIEIVSREDLYATYNVPYTHIPLECGDVLDNNGRLVVIMDVTDEEITCLPLKGESNGDLISIDGVRYNPLFGEIFKTKKHNMERVNVISSNLLLSLRLRYDNYLKFLGDLGKIRRGSVITSMNKYFYVIGELGDTYNGFQIYKKQADKMAQLHIGNDVFYTDFMTKIQFLKKDHEYSFYTNATPYEMNEIKEIKKSYIKENTPKKPTPSKKRRAEIRKNNEYFANINSGSIVEDLFGKKQYIVIIRQDRRIVVMNMKNYQEFNYTLEELNVKDVRFVSLFHPIAFRKLLEELALDKSIIKGHISKENLKLLLK